MMDTKWSSIDATFHAVDDVVSFNFEFIDSRLVLSISTREFDASFDICPRNSEADNVMAMFSFKGYIRDMAAARYKDLVRRIGSGSYANDTCFAYFDVAKHDSEYSNRVLKAIELFVDSVIDIKQVFADFKDASNTSMYGSTCVDGYTHMLPIIPMHIIEQIM